MRNIDLIVIHCSATPPDMDIGAAEIRKWHTDKGWNDIGYHLVIRRDGTLEMGRPFSVVGAHAKGHNANSIGVAMIGGIDAAGEPDNNFRINQWATLNDTLDVLAGFGAKVIGHREVNPHKACPSFSVDDFMAGRKQ